MMLQIELEDTDEVFLDPGHDMGVTEDGYNKLVESLSWLGAVQNVEVVG